MSLRTAASQAARKAARQEKPLNVSTALAPARIPQGFFFVQDTREQEPLFNHPPLGLDVLTETVHDGDYTIKGLEPYFAIERKKMSDLYGYLGNEWKAKTEAKLVRFRDMIKRGGWVALVIEASEADVLAGYEHSKLPPENVRAKLLSVEVRYGVHVYYNRDRDAMARWVLDRAIKFYNIKREVL